MDLYHIYRLSCFQKAYLVLTIQVKWLCVANTRFGRVGHLKNKLNESQPVLVGRDGQEIEERCGEELLKLIDEEADRLLVRGFKDPVPTLWDD